VKSTIADVSPIPKTALPFSYVRVRQTQTSRKKPRFFRISLPQPV
jgi:hypothetical protein